MHAYNSKLILAFKCVGTNAVVVKRVHCISHGRLMDKKQLLNIMILHVLRPPRHEFWEGHIVLPLSVGMFIRIYLVLFLSPQLLLYYLMQGF